MPEVRIDRDGGVAILTLAAPERRNSITVAMAAEIVAACDELDADPTVGAVVVAGEGKTFCAGGDRGVLGDAGEDPARPDRYAAVTAVYRAFTRVGELEAPTIAAVAGHAVGAGLNLMLATDLRVVAEDVVITSGFIPIGLHPGGGHTALLTRTGAREAAAALTLFGERIDGRRAVELGLAWRAVPTAEVLDTALELARVPGADPELSRRTARSLRLIAGPPALPWPAALDAERSAQMWTMRRAAESKATSQSS
jgi:enoyl-CoA hydratase